MIPLSRAGLSRTVCAYRRSIITYTLLSIPLIVFTVAPFVPKLGWFRIAIRASGIGSLVLMVAVLTVTPLARLLKAPGLTRYRRAIGLAAFFYALSHTVVYVWSSQMWDMSFPRFLRRRYILWGIAALYLLIPLALTSTQASLLRMGPERWRRLHLAVFPALAFTLIHYALPGYSGAYWRIYALLGLLLAGWRVVQVLERRRQGGGGAREPELAA